MKPHHKFATTKSAAPRSLFGYTSLQRPRRIVARAPPGRLCVYATLLSFRLGTPTATAITAVSACSDFRKHFLFRSGQSIQISANVGPLSVARRRQQEDEATFVLLSCDEQLSRIHFDSYPSSSQTNERAEEGASEFARHTDRQADRQPASQRGCRSVSLSVNLISGAVA